MPEIAEWNPEDPRKVYEALIQRCKTVKAWYVRCIVDESWTGFTRDKEMTYTIENGVITFKVIAFTYREACLRVVDAIPVLKFLDDYNDE